MKPKRLLKNIRVQFISLVDKPANRKRIIAKSEDFDEDSATFSKTVKIEKIDEEKRVVYGIVYAPNEVDAHGDTTTQEEIEKALERFMLEGRTKYVDKNHDYTPDEGFVRESWIVKEGDPLFDEVGAWAVGIKVTNDETWQQIKKGELTGLSFAGWAEVEEVQKAEPKWVVQPVQNLPFADPDTQWSFNAADEDAIIEKYGWQGMKKAHLVVDESESSVPEKKAAYKFPIAKIIDGRLKIVPKAIFSAAAYLNGARGVSINLPSDIQEKLKKRLTEYYHAMDKKAPWEEKSFFKKLGEFFGFIEKKEEVDEVEKEKIMEEVEKMVSEKTDEAVKKALESVEEKIKELEKSLLEKVEKLEKSDEVGKLKDEIKKLSEDMALLKSTIISKAQQAEKSKEEKSIFKGLI